MKLIDLEANEDYVLDGKYAVRAGADKEVGRTCYKIYISYPNPRRAGEMYDYYCDTVRNLEFWRENNPGALYVRERTFTKNDRIKLGKTVFWTREEGFYRCRFDSTV